MFCRIKPVQLMKSAPLGDIVPVVGGVEVVAFEIFSGPCGDVARAHVDRLEDS